MKLLDNKIVVIVGGTSGIGYSTSIKCAKEGALVYSLGRHEVNFENENILYKYIDVTNSDLCKNVLNDIYSKESRIDALVVCAGITKDSLTIKMNDEQFDEVLNTNLKGLFNCVKVIGPLMEQQDNGGSIVTISSVVGEYGNIGQANYAASKAGIIGMSKSWAKEFARKGKPVRVNVVAPGYILTDMVKTVPEELLNKFASQTMLKRLGQPEEIANVIAFLCSDESSYITGSVIDINGGMRL